MKRCLIVFFVFAFFTTGYMGAAYAKIDLVTLSERASVQTTIYNHADLTLVRDKRVLNFSKGMNRLQFSWANTRIDPTSLSLEIKQHNDQIDVKEITYPPASREVGIWHIQSQKTLQVPVEITYFTSGISWQSYYIVILSKDRKNCHLTGYVKVSNFSGEDYSNAQTRLVVGKLNILDEIAQLAARQYPYGRPEQYIAKPDLHKAYREGKRKLVPAPAMAPMESDAIGAGPKEIKKEGLSEYFLYTIEGQETIPNGWSKRLLSFEADQVKVASVYKYESERFGQQVIRFLKFKNSTDNNLGMTPLPGGEIKVFHKTGNQGQLEYLGADRTKYIPVDKKVELNLGSTLRVKVRPKVIGFRKENIIFDNKGNVSGFDEVKDIKVELSNFTDAHAAIEYTKNMQSSHFKVSSINYKDQYEKVDQDTVKFTIILEPHTKKDIKFTLTTMIGERQWQQ